MHWIIKWELPLSQFWIFSFDIQSKVTAIWSKPEQHLPKLAPGTKLKTSINAPPILDKIEPYDQNNELSRIGNTWYKNIIHSTKVVLTNLQQFVWPTHSLILRI